MTTGGAAKKFMGGIGLNPIQVANCMIAVEHLAPINKYFHELSSSGPGPGWVKVR